MITKQITDFGKPASGFKDLYYIICQSAIAGLETIYKNKHRA